MDPTDQPRRGYVSLVLKKIRGERYSAYSLIDLHLHAIGLYAGQDMSMPEVADGIAPGIPEHIPIVDGRIDGVGAALGMWWTGPLPILHIRIDTVSPDGPALRLEVCIGLLPTNIRILEASCTAHNHEEWMQNAGFIDLVVNGIINLILDNLTRKLQIWIWGILAGIACQLAVTSPGNAIAIGMILVYTALFIEAMLNDVARVLDDHQDAIARFYMILFLGLYTLFGVALVSLVLPVILYGVRHRGAIVDWFMERTDASMLSIGIRFTMALAVLCYALMVGPLTAFDY